jgi:nickel/cobalt transporter (NicO) family protein
MSAPFLLLSATVAVAVVHSILPDHWVPLAVVGRTQRWGLGRVARVSALAASGHVLASLVLAGIVALIGLQFRQQIEAQQGHIVGAVLALTGVGFLIWGLTGHGHPHSHGGEPGAGHAHDEPAMEHEAHDDQPVTLHAVAHHEAGEHDDHALAEADVQDRQAHQHGHSEAELGSRRHSHQHAHGSLVHSHRHEAFIEERRQLLEAHSQERTLAARLATIAVPFGVAASPDLSLLPLALAAAAYGTGTVVAVMGLFSIVTIATFVGLTVAATAIGYQVKGDWLEENANTITALVLIVIGIIAFIGL